MQTVKRQAFTRKALVLAAILIVGVILLLPAGRAAYAAEETSAQSATGVKTTLTGQYSYYSTITSAPTVTPDGSLARYLSNLRPTCSSKPAVTATLSTITCIWIFDPLEAPGQRITSPTITRPTKSKALSRTRNTKRCCITSPVRIRRPAFRRCQVQDRAEQESADQVREGQADQRKEALSEGVWLLYRRIPWQTGILHLQDQDDGHPEEEAEDQVL